MEWIMNLLIEEGFILPVYLLVAFSIITVIFWITNYRPYDDDLIWPTSAFFTCATLFFNIVCFSAAIMRDFVL